MNYKISTYNNKLSNIIESSFEMRGFYGKIIGRWVKISVNNR